jgi:alkanesulfonate monooxygenase SsuD/methylene tetrahydromethanopterin reductase-like flavin-dependent oxidoreductase (luciferase family)
MRVWQFTEQSYHPAWDIIEGPTRIVVPAAKMDSGEVSDLFNRYLDEWLFGDELGLDIMVNEHHASTACMSNVCGLTLAILARQTKQARLLALGVPLANRVDPMRIAEELTYIDNLSRGRLEVGFVRGSPQELFISNQNPVGIDDRFWEAHDLIMKAFRTLDGPFSWEGRYFQYRAANLLPPVYQKPHPPIWIPGSASRIVQTAARMGYVNATFMNGLGAHVTMQAYRDEYRQVHGRLPAHDRLAYLGMVAVGNNHAQARARAAKMAAYGKAVARMVPGTANPPGYTPVPVNVKALMGGAEHNPWARRMVSGGILPANPSLEDLADGGSFFWGTPDEVFQQITAFDAAVGGFGHLLASMQAGYLEHDDTVDSLRLFAREVLPRLNALAPERGARAAEYA